MRIVSRIAMLIGKGVLALLSVTVIILSGFYASDPTYFGRFYRLPFVDIVKDVDFYEPLEVVKGVPSPPLTRAANGAQTVDAAAWQAALNYAVKMDTLALVVWHQGAVQYEYYKPGFKSEDRTDPASMHKSVIALVVGAAVADGYIRSIDDPVATYIPEWAGDTRKAITIRHLLTMSSGLAREPFGFSPFNAGLRLNLGTEISELTLGIQADIAPGTVFSYYNFNPQVLGLIIERVTGKRYAQYLSERIWSRLGTRDAYVFLDHEGGLARTYCCLQASAEDWIRVGLLHLNKGRVSGDQVLPEDWMRQVITPSPLNPNYGFQTWLGTTYEPVRGYGEGVPIGVPHREPFAAPDVIYFDGAGGQRVYVIPSRELVIVRTGAGGIDFEKGQFTWDDSALPNAILRGLRAP